MINSRFLQYFISREYDVIPVNMPKEGLILKGLRHFAPETAQHGFVLLATPGEMPEGYADIENLYIFYEIAAEDGTTVECGTKPYATAPVEPAAAAFAQASPTPAPSASAPLTAPASPTLSVPALMVRSRPDAPHPLHRFWNRLAELWEMLEAWDRQLDHISTTSPDYQRLIDCCDTILTEPISLIDKHFNYVAYSGQLSEKRGYTMQFVDDHRAVPMDIATRLIIDPEYHDLEGRTGIFDFTDDYHFIARNIFYGEEYVGRLICICTENEIVDQYQGLVLEHLGDFVERMYAKNTTFYLEQPALPQMHGLLLQSLEAGTDSAQWIPLLSQIGWKADDPYQLIQLQPTFRYEKNLYPEYLCPQIEHRWPFTLAVVHDDALLILMNLRLSPDQSQQEFACFLRDNLMCSGNSRAFDQIVEIPAAYRQSSLALTYGRKKNPHFWYHDFDDYAFDVMVDRMKGDFSGQQLCHPALLVLMEEDRQRHTQYFLTLRTYLKNRYNSVASAKELFIHRTTFIKRMEHIEKLIHLDLDDWNTRLYLMFSFKLLEEEMP